MPLNRRLAGILLHPTSLPGPYGIGDLGPSAYRLLDWMENAGLAYWQVLPLGPTSFGDSPYQCFSAFAGNPLLVSPELLVRDGFLTAEEIVPPPFPPARVDYGWVIAWKRTLFQKAFQRFSSGALGALRDEFENFVRRPDVVKWLDDFALFMACKDAHNGEPWNTWEADLRLFKKVAVERARKRLAESVDFHRFCQFLFFRQWDALRAECHRRGIKIIGDAPIYVAYDSADVWAHQKLFLLDEEGNPTHVAGVPPDYFSTTGQLWGNPIYNWKLMEKQGFTWWIDRMRSILALVDIVRLDHFRGFMGYWSVPYGSPTAENGEWVRGPGKKLFTVLQKELGSLPIIAEDLGEITTDVVQVRKEFGLPGMRVMQFAWSVVSTDPFIPDPNNPFMLHHHDANTVVYTGTHDNDTTIGWWRNSSKPEERTCMQLYLATDGNAANWDLIRASFMSVANTAIVPAQDFLGLDSDARMNFPGRPEGNWTWRLVEGQLDEHLAHRIRCALLLYERCANPPDYVKEAKPKEPLY
ncbi:MAG: 4-alpha-glucanotransferase [Candidatus Sumerlaeaceae bacterium]|nr:4-alpha-glucanotransferase [Candidatus Sumerlaeaceae bacterium]